MLKSRDKSVEGNITLDATKKENDRWFIRLGTSAYFTNEDEKIELCYILDDFLNEYQKAYDTYKKTLGASSFEIVDTDYIKILSLSRSVWMKILKFSHEFDIDNGNSEWHIFISSQTAIIVQHRNAETYNTCLVAETTGASLITNLDSYDEVNILWKIPDATDFYRDSCWNAETTAKWLKDQLIPNVISHFTPLKLSLLQLIVKKLKHFFRK